MSKTHKCDWPRCAEETNRWFTDGWAACSDGDDLPPGLPDDCLLCPTHALAYEALVVGEPLPTNAQQ
jgi:hypothetical protein